MNAATQRHGHTLYGAAWFSLLTAGARSRPAQVATNSESGGGFFERALRGDDFSITIDASEVRRHLTAMQEAELRTWSRRRRGGGGGDDSGGGGC